MLACALALLLLATLAAGQDKELLSLTNDLGAVLEWDPLRDAGVLAVGDDRISIAVGTDSALINYRVRVQIDPPARRQGVVWLSTKAVAAIGDAMERDRLAHADQRTHVACILIDPGHGGRDGGGVGSYAVGKNQVQLKEKDVTLRVALLLADMLKQGLPDRQVIFTRSTDTTVSLEKRVETANSLLERTKDTVLFLSIHANTTPFNKTASGFEVWVLPPEYPRTLVDISTTGQENQDILPILNSMREEEISLESTILAQQILSGLDAKIGKQSPDRGLRQNDWYVVRNARMPAVLTEVGFVTNAEEAARLAEPAYLKDVAEGMYNGIIAFIDRLERDGGNGAG